MMNIKKLKICYMGDARSPHIVALAESFAKRGHEVHVVSPHNAKIQGVKVHPTKKKYNKYLNALTSIIEVPRLIRRINPDLLHAHYLGLFSFLGALSGTHPFMATIWGSDIKFFAERNKINKAMFQYILNKSDLIQVCDKNTINFLKKRYKINPKKVRSLYWGTNPERFKPVKSKKNIQVLYLRRAVPKYSPEVFIRALGIVKKEFPKITSTMMEGKDYPEIKNLIKKHKLEKNIKILKWISHSELPNLINSSLIYVDTIHSNLPGVSIGITSMEAMSCELPIVFGNSPGVNEYMINNYNALLYKRGDHNELAKYIIKLLNNKKLRRKLGKNARKTVIEKLDWDTNLLKIEKKYLELASKQNN